MTNKWRFFVVDAENFLFSATHVLAWRVKYRLKCIYFKQRVYNTSKTKTPTIVDITLVSAQHIQEAAVVTTIPMPYRLHKHQWFEHSISLVWRLQFELVLVSSSLTLNYVCVFIFVSFTAQSLRVLNSGLDLLISC